MKSKNYNLHKLENELKKIYLEKEHIETGTNWQMNVMRTVRNIGPLNVKSSVFRFANRFVWEFAGFACILVVVLSFYAVYTGYNPITVANDFLFGNPVEIAVAQALGAY